MWTDEEIAKLKKLLFSNDENNSLLAMELIKSNADFRPFIPALCFMYALEDEAPEVMEKLEELISHISESDKNYWLEKLRLISDLWSLKKKEFLKALEQYSLEMEVFDAFIGIAPRYAHVYHSIGRILIDKANKRDSGLQFLRKALAFDPDFYEVHFDYAFNLPEQKKFADEIIYHYQCCIDLGADSFEPYHNQARIYAILKGQAQKGIEVFEEGLRHFPGTVHMMVEMAYILDDINENDKARHLLEEAIDKDSTFALAYNNLAFLLFSKFSEIPKALELILKAIEINPNNGLYWHTLAEIEWYGLKNKQNALDALYKARELKYKEVEKMISELEKLIP